MPTESIVRALVTVLSGVFESLPPKAQRQASLLIAESANLIDDVDAKRLMATFHAED